MVKTKINTLLLTLALPLTLMAQGLKPLPSLHTEGRWLTDTHGNHVVLHGVMDTPNPYFNNYRWGNACNDGTVNDCLAYFEKLFTGLEKAKCNVFRLHLDPCWTNDPSKPRIGDGGEHNISQYSPTRLEKYLRTLYFPLARKAIDHGLYVVVRPPGVCPGDLKVGDDYQAYLLNVWDIFTQNDSIRRMAGQISIELANEPVRLNNASNKEDTRALHDYFQPIVDKIRQNGFTGVVWVPGTGWQSNYASYATYPIEGNNIGYAVHDYTGWYGCSDDTPSPTNKINQFHRQVPVVDNYPIIITEVDWSPRKPGTGHYNEHGEWVESNYGTWSTGSTSKWGKAYKAMLDHYGNISMTLSGTHCLIDVDTLLQKNGKVVPAFGGLAEACGKACMDWYAEFYKVDYPRADFVSVPTSDQGSGRYKNPILSADFGGGDVVRADGAYYMATVSPHYTPGLTLLKSTDLVNWEYCAQPAAGLQGVADALDSGGNCSLQYHAGRFYLMVDGGDNGGCWLLTASHAEDRWEARPLNHSYHAPGLLFDDGKVFVACGAGDIDVCELDADFNLVGQQRAVSGKTGLEGCRLYHIGDYYYLYGSSTAEPATTWIFRSKDINGPWEERVLLEPTINGRANTLHGGTLVETASGEWWTLFYDSSNQGWGRMVNLQPVSWQKDAWPYIANRGRLYSTWKKPTPTGENVVKRLPTTDNFRTFPLGMQWQWRGGVTASDWSLFERPGWLRLKATVPDSNSPAPGAMLTQRMFWRGSDTPTKATVRLDVSQLQQSDRAGLCLLQGGGAMVYVEVFDGSRHLTWRTIAPNTSGDVNPEGRAVALPADSTIVYLSVEASDQGTLSCYYSLDNHNYTPIATLPATVRAARLSRTAAATTIGEGRFALFCHTVSSDSRGVADFDWFTTEEHFDEASVYPPFTSAAGKEAYTIAAIEAPQSVEAMVGGWSPTGLTATYGDGHTESVAATAEYKVESPDVVEIIGGRVSGLRPGTTTVSATVTDLLGNVATTTFEVNATFFPFGSQFVSTDIFDHGIYNEKNHAFKPGQYGQMGWVYADGADMSGYKYLVLKLRQKQTCDAHLSIYPSTNIWGDCFSTPTLGNELQYVVDLSQATYTSGDNKGRRLDMSDVHIVSFWGNGKGIIVVDDMYLTNNADYSPQDPSSVITPMAEGSLRSLVTVYSLTGQPLRRATARQQALEGLPPGIYLVDGKKVLKK